MKRTAIISVVVVAAATAGTGAFVTRSHRARQSDKPSPSSALGPDGGRIPAAGTGAGKESAIFEVTSANGEVEVERAGQWIDIKRGDTLTRTDVVRTGVKSNAVLRLDDAGTEIELRAGVEIGLDRLPGGARVDLRRGKVLARVNMADALAITSHETRTTTEGPARFVVLADERGQVSVAALEGTARFSAAGKSITLPPGTASVSRNGAPPDDPERIPEEVLLNVVWPADERHGADAEIAGRTAPSSTVSINGIPTTVGPDGHFALTVPLREGRNVMNVEAEDLAGRTRHDGTTLVRRPHLPTLTPETRDLWKK